MSDIQPPPTYALPILVDEKTGKASFSPIWLNWFLELAQLLNTAGGTTIGDVVGPASSTNEAVARWDGTDGKTLQNSGVVIDDSVNVFIVDKNFKYRYVSDSMLKNLSICENEVINKTFFEVFGYENLSVKENDKKVIFEALTIETEECETIDDKVKYFKVIKKPFFNKNKEIIGLIGSSMDITKIKEAQIKAEKEKEYELSFNQNYVHEVNNIFHKKTQIKYLLSIESILEEEKGDLLESLEHLENMHFQLMQNFSLHHNNLLQEKEILLEKKSVNIIKLIEKEIRYFNLCYKYLYYTALEHFFLQHQH
jgi:hypothetical protein